MCELHATPVGAIFSGLEDRQLGISKVELVVAEGHRKSLERPTNSESLHGLHTTLVNAIFGGPEDRGLSILGGS